MPHKDTLIYKVMFEAVCETFENMAFVVVEKQSDEIVIEIPTEGAWVSILINNPLQAELRLALPQEVLTTMTSDMFSIDVADVEESQRQDVLAEILNTLAGVFMTKLLPDDQTYQLGLPEHGEGPLPVNEEESLVWNLQIENSPLVLVANGAGFLPGKNLADSLI
jgi:hypothetical protein